ncbi:hypothetical protein ACLOJK_030820 [Asimina triloba]
MESVSEISYYILLKGINGDVYLYPHPHNGRAPDNLSSGYIGMEDVYFQKVSA